MAPMLPIHPTIVTFAHGDQEDLERGIAFASNCTSSVSETSTHGHKPPPVVGLENGGSDAAAQVDASVWTKKQLIIAYGLLWLITAVSTTFDNIFDALGPYVASHFHLHSFAAATGIVAHIVAAVSPAPFSKLLQRFGRAQGLSSMLVIWIVGLVMLAACQSISTFSVAQVFTAVGSTGVTYCISVFVADTTSLRNRGLMMSFSTSPAIFTMWVSGPAASSLLGGIGWRWGFGIFSLALPMVMVPFITMVFWNQQKAARKGALAEKDTSQTDVTQVPAFDRLKKVILEVDAAGLLILVCGFALFLLPFTLYSFQPAGFGSPLIASSIAIGLALIITYIFYERYLAPTTSISFGVLRDRTVLLSLLTLTLTIIACCNITGYFMSYLQVVTSLSIIQSSYLLSSIRVAVCIWTLLIGLIIRYTGRLKHLVLVTGIPLMMVAAGIFLHFRSISSNTLGVMIGIVALLSISLGTTVLCATLIMMAALGQEHNTTVLALISFLTNIAPAIGEAIDTGIWTWTFKKALHRHLPDLTEKQVAGIYTSLEVQMSFPEGSVIREGIAEAYADAKFYMLVTSFFLLGAAMVSTLGWRDLRAIKTNTENEEEEPMEKSTRP